MKNDAEKGPAEDEDGKLRIRKDQLDEEQRPRERGDMPAGKPYEPTTSTLPVEMFGQMDASLGLLMGAYLPV